MTPHEQLVWAAGFFDGDGCFSLRKEKNRRTHEVRKLVLIAQVMQTHPEPLERLAQVAGHGRVRGPYNFVSQKKPIYQWRITSSKAEELGELLRPFLCTYRREQLDQCLREIHSFVI